jgi:creatinine amidohydrolase
MLTALTGNTMIRRIIAARVMTVFALLLFCTPQGWSQAKLSTHWEELTAADFRAAIQQSQGACLLPFGILEKHGPHLPLGTDLLDVRYAALHAAEQEYAVVFPEYYFGQIFEARHEPGTVAYSRELQLQLLQETTDEMARNGCKEVIIVNGHGGNGSLLPFFAQSQLQKPHDYVVYVLVRVETPPGGPVRKGAGPDAHAGETETSSMLIAHPELVHQDRAKSESGPTSIGKNCRRACTPESGGIRVSPITTPGMVPWPRPSSARPE